MEFMRRSLIQLGLVVLLVITSVGSAYAATNAYDAKYVTSVTYMNIGSYPANLNLTFYVSGTGSTVEYQLLDIDGSARVIPVKASATLAVSTVSALNSDSKYGAVVTSNQQLIATMAQVANDTIIRTQPISNGFAASDASSTIVLPAVMKSCFSDELTTRFSVQNAGSAAISDLTITLKWPNGVSTTSGITVPSALAAGDVLHFDMSSVSVGAVPSRVTLPTGCAFSGSALISSATVGSKLVATAVELSTVNKYANSYEGMPGNTSDGALTLYFPSAMCRVNYGDGEQSTSYAVQNLTSASANIVVEYTYRIRATDGSLGTEQNKTLRLTIPANGKGSITGCDLSKNTVGNTNDATGSGMPAAAVGSAIITSNRNIVGLQKISGGGISAATPAIITGGDIVNTPFVRYSVSCFTATPTATVCRNESRQRTFFAVQNIGNAPAKIRMNLYNHLGVLVGTYTTPSLVAIGGKVSLDPTKATSGTALNEFGYNVEGSNLIYAGSAQFKSLNNAGNASLSSIAVVVRVLSMTPLGQTGDDYNGTPQ